MAIFVGPTSGVTTTVIHGGGATGAFLGVSTTTTGRNAGVGTVTGAIIYNETDEGMQYYNGTTWREVTSPFSATGGNVANGLEPGNGYAYHTFTASGSLTLVGGTKTGCEVLVVGGGGGGGGSNNSGSDGGGGGGGGGVAWGSAMPIGPGTYNITVGTGGEGGPGNSTSSTQPGCANKSQPYSGTQGETGVDSVFAASSPTSIKVTGKGGGGGGSGPNAGNGDCGGSGGGGGGGGAATTDSGYATNQPTANPGFSHTLNIYGTSGGDGPTSPEFTGGGGGGAGGTGGNGGSGGPAKGGSSQPLPAVWSMPVIGQPAWNPYRGQWAAGGSGGRQTNVTQGSPISPNGTGGGSGGATTAEAGDGYDGTGGGGGGGAGGSPYMPTPNNSNPRQIGGDGGPGIVVFRYPV